MTSDLRDLYQQVIVDHSKKPRNFRELGDANRTAEGYNPLCGDRIILYVRLDGDTIADVGFQGEGCAISRASASMMTAALKGKTRTEAEALFDTFHHLVTGEPGAPEDTEALGKLKAFSGVSEFPIRIKCASLPWHTLRAALENKESVSVE